MDIIGDPVLTISALSAWNQVFTYYCKILSIYVYKEWQFRMRKREREA